MGFTLSHAGRVARFLCEAVPKVTEGCLRGFWHLWHLDISGFSERDHVLGRGGQAIYWLEALKNLSTETTSETKMATDAASCAADFTESLTQQGDKSAKR